MKNSPDDYAPTEKENFELASEYMQIAYDPKRASTRAVAHFCGPKTVSLRLARFLKSIHWNNTRKITRTS